MGLGEGLTAWPYMKGAAGRKGWRGIEAVVVKLYKGLQGGRNGLENILKEWW